MKYFQAGILCLVLLAFMGRLTSVTPAVHEDVLLRAFAGSGAEPQELSVTGWIRLPAEALSDDQMEKLVCRAMERLGYPSGEYRLSRIAVPYRQVRAELQEGRERVMVIVREYSPPGEEQMRDSYMSISLEHMPPVRREQVREEVASILQEKGGIAQVNTCLAGWLDGKLEEEKKRFLLQQAFQAVHAHSGGEFSQAGIYSRTGYTPLLDGEITAGAERINLHMVIRYSSHDDKTYILAGTPVLTREY